MDGKTKEALSRIVGPSNASDALMDLIGLSKAPYMGLEHDTAAMEMMRSLKRLFDPHNILNPGKMGLENASWAKQQAATGRVICWFSEGTPRQ